MPDTYRVTSPDGPEVTVPKRTVTIPAEKVTLIADSWRVERDGKWLGAVNSVVGVQPGADTWRAFWFLDGDPNGGAGSNHATRDEAVAAVVAGTGR